MEQAPKTAAKIGTFKNKNTKSITELNVIKDSINNSLFSCSFSLRQKLGNCYYRIADNHKQASDRYGQTVQIIGDL